MQHVRQIIFLSLFIFMNLSPQEGLGKKTILEKPPKIIPLYLQEISEILYNLIKNQQSQQQPKTTQQFAFNEIDIEEMKLIFESSPKEAQEAAIKAEIDKAAAEKAKAEAELWFWQRTFK